jgi:hypothetical protein
MPCDGFQLIALPFVAGGADETPGDGVDIIIQRI